MNNLNSNKIIKQTSKQFLNKNQNKFSLNSKSFCEKNQTSNNSTENLGQRANESGQKEEFISFGFKTVKKDERQEMVNSVFANVAKRYFSLFIFIYQTWNV